MKHFSIFFVFSLFSVALIAQNKKDFVPFNGIIKDIFDAPIKNARIYISSPQNYVRSDGKGRFGLSNVNPTDTIKILIKKQLYLIPVEGKKSIKIKLADQYNYQAEEDQHLVDLGYGYVKRREYNGVSSGISGEDLVKTGKSTILEALQGKVAGLYVNPGNIYNSESTTRIRGYNTNGPTTPLFLVDGVEVESLDGVSLYSVDYVEILKDASIYGVRGSNGAILVHTKKGGN